MLPPLRTVRARAWPVYEYTYQSRVVGITFGVTFESHDESMVLKGRRWG